MMHDAPAAGRVRSAATGTARPEQREPRTVPAPTLAAQHRAFADALGRSGGRSPRPRELRDDGSATATGCPMPPAMRASSATVLASPPPAAPDEVQMAAFDRIAAAIAELTQHGADAEVTMSFPAGGYRVSGAVLGRDAAGQVHVTLLSQSAVPPTVAAQWAGELTEHLARRALRPGRIRVRADADCDPTVTGKCANE